MSTTGGAAWNGEIRTRFHTCPLCEACCNLEIQTRGREVIAVRGDERDPFSRGYLCPKGAEIGQLDRDPDRIRVPQIRRGDTWSELSWDDAFAEIERRLRPILDRHSPSAVGIYLGNPSAHHVALGLYARVLIKALRTRSVFSASTVDQMPKQIAAGWMFGTALSIPVPDLDRTEHLLVLGANPLVSNGSLMTAPDIKQRIRDIRARGGKVVVIDPRRTRTAAEADEHHFIRPGTDALLLLGMVHTLFEEHLVSCANLDDHTVGFMALEEASRAFPPERIAPACRIAAGEIRRFARELATAPRAAVYARIGTCTQEFGTTTSWLVDVLNLLTGNLDREGGAMFPCGAAGAANTLGDPGRGRGIATGRWKSRVSGIPEVLGELPVGCLAEEIETPGEGQIRALITVAGNPVLSTPNGARLARALGGLELMVSLDIYRNETTRHAHVLLPGLSPLEQSHYPLAFTQLAIRNFARYSAPLFTPPEGQLPEWQVLLRLAGIATGQGPSADIDALDDFVFEQQLGSALGNPRSPIHGRDADEIRRMVSRWRGPERLLDLMLRVGPYGDGFGAKPEGLTLAVLAAEGHAVDLGPLTPRLPGVLRTPSGKIELAPERLVADLARLEQRLAEIENDDRLVLIGRRDLRSNNSWMHNLPGLVSGKPRCTLHVHPEDAKRLGLEDGAPARVRSRTGEIEVPVEVTEDVMPGVTSLPHGWGHTEPGIALTVAREHAGVCSNYLADEKAFDPLSGNAVLNGIPVEVEAVAVAAAPAT